MVPHQFQRNDAGCPQPARDLVSRTVYGSVSDGALPAVGMSDPSRYVIGSNLSRPSLSQCESDACADRTAAWRHVDACGAYGRTHGLPAAPHQATQSRGIATGGIAGRLVDPSGGSPVGALVCRHEADGAGASSRGGAGTDAGPGPRTDPDIERGVSSSGNDVRHRRRCDTMFTGAGLSVAAMAGRGLARAAQRGAPRAGPSHQCTADCQAG